MHHVAIVYAPRGVLFLSVAHSRVAREHELAGYVRKQASRQLSPSTGEQVLELMRQGATSAAVRLYFEAVVREWDEEWLFLETLDDPGVSSEDKLAQPMPRFRVSEKAPV